MLLGSPLVQNAEDESMVKLSCCLITAIDGSDTIIPTMKENKVVFGKVKGTAKNQPVIGIVSILYDCINLIVLDTQIDKLKYSEPAMATNHLPHLKKTIR